MSASKNVLQRIHDGAYDNAFARLYGLSCVRQQRFRYATAVEQFVRIFGDSDVPLHFFSAPGRTEICGNHTDHNNGRVVAASVDLDIVAVVRPTDGVVRIQSEGYALNEVDLNETMVFVEKYIMADFTF